MTGEEQTPSLEGAKHQKSIWSTVTPIIAVLALGVSVGSYLSNTGTQTVLYAAAQQELDGRVTALERSVVDLKTSGVWPAGTYAVLQNGPCPEGWRKEHGRLAALNIQSMGDNHITRSKFGRSEIKAHDNDDGLSLAEISLHVCLKD